MENNKPDFLIIHTMTLSESRFILQALRLIDEIYALPFKRDAERIGTVEELNFFIDLSLILQNCEIYHVSE